MTTELHYGGPREAGMDPARVERIQGLARGWVEEGVHPALVVLAARKGVIFLHEAFGRLRPDDDTPLPKDAIFPVASATKPFTAACVMLLVEEGRIGLMRPVRDYFPEVTAEGTEEVLVHHLLCHLAGWRDPDLFAEAARRRREIQEFPPPEPGQNRDIADYILLTSRTPLSSPPGEAMQYSDHSFTMLGELVRRVTGRSLEVFAQERIFEPLGLHDCSYVLPPEHRARKVRRAQGLPGTLSTSRFDAGIDSERSESQPWGGRGLHTSAGDYAIFIQMLLNGGKYGEKRILSRASVEAMRRNHIPAGTPLRMLIESPGGELITREHPGGYGYGLFPFQPVPMANINGGLASLNSFGHSGALSSYWWADPDRDLFGVYFSVAARPRSHVLPGPGADEWGADLFVDAVTAAVGD
jgi:CubicO group peptidase (beta-lactamase class C family)